MQPAGPLRLRFSRQTLSTIALSIPSLASTRGGSSRKIGGGGAQGEAFGNTGNNASAASSPVMASVGHSSVSGAVGSDGPTQPMKRSVAMAGLDSSPGSIDDVDDNDAREEKKRQPVKRACNECRQQKASFFGLVPMRFHWLTFGNAATMRCGPGPLHGLFAMSSVETRLQN